MKPFSDTLQPPATVETDGKTQTVSKDIEEVKIEKTSGSSSTCLMNIKHGETTVSFRFQ